MRRGRGRVARAVALVGASGAALSLVVGMPLPAAQATSSAYPTSAYAAIQKIALPTYPDQIVAGDDTVWVALDTSPPTIRALDPRSGSLVGSGITLTDNAYAMATSDDSLFAMIDHLPAPLAVINPSRTSGPVDDSVYTFGASPYTMTATQGGDVFIPLQSSGVVLTHYRGNLLLDDTARVSGVTISQIFNMAASDDSVYLPVNTGNKLAVMRASNLDDSMNVSLPTVVAPRSAALTSNGLVYVSGQTASTIDVINPQNGSAVRTITGLATTNSMNLSLSADDTAYVVSRDFPSSIVNVVNPGSSTVDDTVRLSSFLGSYAAYWGGGVLYVADSYQAKAVVAVAPVSGSLSANSGAPGSSLSATLTSPSSVSMDDSTITAISVGGVAATKTRTGSTWSFVVPAGSGTVDVTATLNGGNTISLGSFTYVLPACVSTSSVVAGTVTETFDDTGACTWTVPSGVQSVTVTLVGGGGGGGAGNGSASNPVPYAGGGGGGGEVKSSVAVSSLTGGQLIDITVGDGGAGGASYSATGGDGGPSIFGSPTPVTAAPGRGGIGGSNSQGGNGGVSGSSQLGGQGGSNASGDGAGGGGGMYPGSPPPLRFKGGEGGYGGIVGAGYYGGGGGGGARTAGDQGGPGGPGGGGLGASGVNVSLRPASAGSVSTGGGGGGGMGYYPSNTSWSLGAAGGSGLVVVSYQAANPPTPPTPPTPPSPTPPSAPTGVSGVPGDGSIIVSWSPPSVDGSYPVSMYSVSTTPSGGTCMASSPATSCVLTGLRNGTAYTFTVAALSGAGWGPGAEGGPVTPGGVTPAPAPVPLPAPLAPGDSALIVNGVPDPNVTVDPKPTDKGLTITGPDFEMDLDGLDGRGTPLNLGPDGVLILNQERNVQTSGRGFMGNSDVDLYVDPPVVSGPASRKTRAASAIYVGTVRTTRAGTFTGLATLPDSVKAGQHVLQAVGTTTEGKPRAMSLGVLVTRSLTLNQGTRTADGMHDRIRTTGSSTGMDAGVKLTPYIKYAGQSTFSEGKASIVLQADGTFTWTRQVKKGKKLTAYVAYTDVKSNEVVWLKVS